MVRYARSTGGQNDRNIPHQSTQFNKIRVGKWPPVRSSINISGKVIDWYYFLTDGIYPKYRIFVQTVEDARTRKKKLFSAHQEGAGRLLKECLACCFAGSIF